MSATMRLVVLGVLAASATVKWNPPTEAVPAFYTVAPQHGNAKLLSGEQLTGPIFNRPYKVTVYQMAAKVESVLFEQPCHCRCDRAMQHKSLHSCFEGTHGAVCATCMREAIYTYQQTQLGRTPEQIRAGIAHGDWQDIDVQNVAM